MMSADPKTIWTEQTPLAPETTVNRATKKPDYLAQRMKGLNNLDRLASFILAVSHSALKTTTYGSWDSSGKFQPSNSDMSDHTKNEGKIQFGCVAVCVVDGILFVGRNVVSLHITLDDLKTFVSGPAPAEPPIETDKFLTEIRDFVDVRTKGNYSDQLHAEMQLVDFLGSPYSRMKYVGVSKPCCNYCQEVLKTYNISFAAGHGDAVVNWLPPPSLSADFAYLERKGDSAKKKERKNIKQTDPEKMKQKRQDAFKQSQQNAKTDKLWEARMK